MRHVAARIVLSAGIAAALVGALTALPASAATSEAVSVCGATNVDRKAGTAKVPSSNVYKTFSTSYGVGSILYCGNGTTWGAVHIEVKHQPPDWTTADKCAEKVERYGSKTTDPGGKTTFTLRLGGPDSFAKLVFGANGVITNYVAGATWSACAQH
jgi:hypothetical protein